MAMILELIGSAVNWMGTGLEFNPEVVAVAKHVGNVWPQQVEMGFIISLLMSVEMILELICSEFNWIDTDMKIIPEVVAVAKQVWNVWSQQVELDIFISIHRSVLAHAKAIGQDLLQWHEMFGQTREMIFELIGFEVNWMGTDVKFILEGVAVAKHVWYEWPQQVELEHAKAIGQDLLHWHEMSGQTMEMILELIVSVLIWTDTDFKFIPEIVAAAKHVWNEWPQQVEMGNIISLLLPVLENAKTIGQDLPQWHEMFGQSMVVFLELIGSEFNWVDLKFIPGFVAVAKLLWYEWPQQVEMGFIISLLMSVPEHAKAIFGQDLLQWNEMFGQTMEISVSSLAPSSIGWTLT